MSILCLWTPTWSTGAASPEELVPAILEEAPRVMVEARGIIWVDGKGLPAERLAERLLGLRVGVGGSVSMGATVGAAPSIVPASSVIPSKAGTQPPLSEGASAARRQLDSRFRGNDEEDRENDQEGGNSRAGKDEGRNHGGRNHGREANNRRGAETLRVGVSAVPIVAEAAARYGAEPLTVVRPGQERDFLASLSLELLTEDQRLLALLEGSGIRNCGDLAALTAEAVEVRFGSDGTRVWKLARGMDTRVLFRPIPPEKPHASVDFVDYTIRDATRLVFTLNALLDQVCGTLRERSRRARSITLTFSLSNGSAVREVMRTARPTADRALWIRRLRAVLERVKLPDTIAGVALEVDATEPISALQGDLFDRGFATASFVEEAVARLLDLYRGLFVRQVNTPHALAERRVQWVDLTPQEVAESRASEETAGRPGLELQLLPEPRPIRVRARVRRDHILPIRYREGSSWQGITAAGPDRISGGHEESHPYAREYYRCVSETGSLLWIYRDAIEDRWYLHGWWD